ncbi:glycosyltransferase family 39 protein [candidate division WOR-3 bacterium]|nr:glycosyltransferase family 39 protein [candidate division WOR-3 bacterium]
MITEKKHILMFLAVFAVSFVRFYGLGDAEIQPWDEAMYASRSKSAVSFGCWLDQTEYSVNGLYSSSHPPLYIWLSALLMKTAGETAFSARFWSAVAAAVLVIFLFVFFRDKLAGFFSALILGTNAFFFSYSRQGQLDVFSVFWMTAGALAFFSRDKNRFYLLLAGFCFGMSLMSKILVGLFLPASIFVYIAFHSIFGNMKFRPALEHFIVFFITGVLLALPWHLYMITKYGGDFIDYFLLFHVIKRTTAGVESNVQRLGVFFYVNQLALMMPVSLALIITKLKKIALDKRPEMSFFFVFFAVQFAVFSLSKTQLRTYSIAFIPALSLITGFCLSDMAKKKEGFFLTVFLSLAFSLWSGFHFMREDTGNILRTPQLIFLLLFFFSSAVLLFLLKKTSKSETAAVFLFFLSLVCGIFAQTRVYYDSGIRDFSENFYSKEFRSLVYVDDSLHLTNPQITYYFNSLDRGADKNRRFTRIFFMPSDIECFAVKSGKTMLIVNSWHENREILEIEKALKDRYRPRMIESNQYYRVYEY